MVYNKYYCYSVDQYFKGLTPHYRVTTPLASFNHVACDHSPVYSDLPVRAMQRFNASGVTSVVLRGCISFNPLYREYSSYSPKLFPRSRTMPDGWERETLFSQYKQYLKWLVSFINEFTLIEYVELFNEFFFKGANYIPINKLLLTFLVEEWQKLKPFCRPVLWGNSEPIIGAIKPIELVYKIDQWRRQYGLSYTGIQLHQQSDFNVIKALQQTDGLVIAITENYSGLTPCTQTKLIYHGY